MSEQADWPKIPATPQDSTQAQATLELFKAKLEVVKAQRQAEIDREQAHKSEIVDKEKTDYENYCSVTQEINKGYIEVAKGAIDRSIQRADFTQKVAVAAGTVYTGVLALSFVAETGKGTPLPVTGMIPAVFFGFSFFLSAAYVSFLTNPAGVKPKPPEGTLMGDAISQRDTFIIWTKAAVINRMHIQQASIVSLGFGILCFPLPYLLVPNNVLWWLLGAGLALTVLIPLVFHLVELFAKRNTAQDDTLTPPVTVPGVLKYTLPLEQPLLKGSRIPVPATLSKENRGKNIRIPVPATKPMKK